jgi:hypothetical protein
MIKTLENLLDDLIDEFLIKSEIDKEILNEIMRLSKSEEKHEILRKFFKELSEFILQVNYDITSDNFPTKIYAEKLLDK